MESMPLVIRIFIMALWLSVIPAAAGGCFQRVLKRDGASGNPAAARVVFGWVSGQMLLWAVFQALCVPCVLRESTFDKVVRLFEAATAALVLAGAVIMIVQREKIKPVPGPERSGKNRVQTGLWLCFFVLLGLQLVQALRLTYADGDDAYYVAVSTITENAETLYRKLPYTGGTTSVDIRHGLAPFPIWIAFLARVSGIPTVSAAHIAVPLMLIPMTYGIFYLLGRRMLKGKKNALPLFLIFTELLTLFGDYSFYTVENFMLARSRQGKAALGSIIFPMLLLLLLVFAERISEGKKSGASYWILLCSVMTAGCLCSTVGSFLSCLFVAVSGICIAVAYRRFKVLPPLVLCCAPCVCYALLYLTQP